MRGNRVKLNCENMCYSHKDNDNYEKLWLLLCSIFTFQNYFCEIYTSTLKMFDPEMISKREAKAQNIQLNWGEVLHMEDQAIYKVLEPYAKIHFVPFDFLFFPFISACGGLAHKSYIKMKGT